MIENGASGLGNAYAGAAAVSADSSTVWFNPAGMLELSGRHLSVAGHILDVDNSFEDRGSTLAPIAGGAQVSGPTSDNPGGTTFLPNVFYVQPINPNLSLGFGLTVPFGSSTEYRDDWTGRYLTVESGVQVIDLNPSIAYRINDKLSIGGGISIQNMSATLGNAVDSASVCSGASSGQLFNNTPFPLNQCADVGLASAGNVATDSYAEVNGDSTAATFNIGVLFKPQPGTKLGAAYRHSIDHTLDGDVDFDVNPALQAILDANSVQVLRDGGAEAEANLPAQLALSAAHQLNDRVQLLADLTWTGWNSFEELRVTFDDGSNPSVSTQDWEDAYRISAGINFKADDSWILRGGVAYDETPIPSVQRRTPRIPGNDRTWLSVGAGYTINTKMSFDVGFTHLMLDDTPIDNTGDSFGSQTVRGVYEGSVNILSAQFNWQFN